MLAMTSVQLGIEVDGGRIRLLSPEVGLFARARATGESLVSGDIAGVLVSLFIRDEMTARARSALQTHPGPVTVSDWTRRLRTRRR